MSIDSPVGKRNDRTSALIALAKSAGAIVQESAHSVQFKRCGQCSTPNRNTIGATKQDKPLRPDVEGRHEIGNVAHNDRLKGSLHVASEASPKAVCVYEKLCLAVTPSAI
jgi:hypothetical protein